MLIEKKLEDLGIKLPKAAAPAAMYIPVKQINNLLFVSGQVPMVNGKVEYTGKIGSEHSIEYGQEAAKICTINMIAALKEYLGDLDKIKNIVKLQGFVSSEVGFDKQHIVINSASQLIFDVFGEKGRHARTAIGTNQLPLDATVEIEAIIEISE